MAMPTCYSTFLNEILQKQQKFLPSCSYLKVEAISAAKILVGWYRHIFCGYKLKYLSRWCLDICSLQMKVLVYIQRGKSIFYFCPPWIGWPQYLDQKRQ